MSITLTSLLLLLDPTLPVDEQFRSPCPPKTCGSLPIRFPLRLQTSLPACGRQALTLTCNNNNDTLLLTPSLPPFKVTHIDYQLSTLTVHIGSLPSPCPLRPLPTLDFFHNHASVYAPDSKGISLVNCSGNFMDESRSPATVAGPIPCLSGPGHFVYVVDAAKSMDVIPDGCAVAETGGAIPYNYQSTQGYGLKEALESFEQKRDVNLSWSVGDCRSCEAEGRLCGYDLEENQIICQISHNHHAKASVLDSASVLDLSLEESQVLPDNQAGDEQY